MKDSYFLFIGLVLSVSCFQFNAKNEPIEIVTESQNQLRKEILNDSYEGVKKAVETGAVINFDDSSKSPLLHALLANKMKAAEALLEEGANPNLMFQGKKIIHYLILKADDRASLLIKYDADYSGNIDENQDVFSFVLNNFTRGYFRYADELIKKGSDIKPFYETNDLSKNIWYQSISNPIGTNPKFIPPISFFLKYGADVNQVFTLPDGTTKTPLIIAIGDFIEHGKPTPSNNLNKINELLKAGADVNKEANPILNKGPQNAFSFVLMSGDESIYDPRLYEILLRDIDFAKSINLFINSGGDPNAKIKAPFPAGYWTLLGLAVNRQDTEAVKTLLNAGVRVVTQFKPSGDTSVPKELEGKNITALDLAVEKPNTEIIELLIQHGAQ